MTFVFVLNNITMKLVIVLSSAPALRELPGQMILDPKTAALSASLGYIKDQEMEVPTKIG